MTSFLASLGASPGELPSPSPTRPLITLTPTRVIARSLIHWVPCLSPSNSNHHDTGRIKPLPAHSRAHPLQARQDHRPHPDGEQGRQVGPRPPVDRSARAAAGRLGRLARPQREHRCWRCRGGADGGARPGKAQPLAQGLSNRQDPRHRFVGTRVSPGRLLDGSRMTVTVN